jgi:hypothetical protein
MKEMKVTELSGFKQYVHSSALNKLEDAYEGLHERLGRVNHYTIKGISREVSSDVSCDINAITSDGYNWFERVEFNGGIVVLFPWISDDRGVNVYLDRKRNGLSRGVDETLETFADRMNDYSVTSFS